MLSKKCQTLLIKWTIQTKKVYTMLKSKTHAARIIVNPIGRENLQFRRKTNRYGKPVGTFSSNQGYLSVSKDANTGRFVSRPA